MIERTYEQIISMANGRGDFERFGNIAVKGVSTDSRSEMIGKLFVPLVGERFDGLDYVTQAFERGAAAALWQEGRPQPPQDVPLIYVEDTLDALQSLAASYMQTLPVRVIGVTGSNGKTTTKDMIASVLATTYKVHKTQGNLNGHIGLPLTILDMDEDTQMAVLEMGMRGRSEIELLSRIAVPEVGVITSIGDAHLERLGSVIEIARAKVEIVSHMKPGGLLVYPKEAALVDQALSEADKPADMLHYRFGESADADIYATGIMTDQDSGGTYFTISEKDSPSYFIPMLGRHNVTNALCAVVVGKYMGVLEADIARGLKTMQATEMRMQVVNGPGGITLVNDAYNASPASVRATLALLEEMRGYERKIVVLGDMLELGERGAEFHREIGRLLNPREIDYVLTFGTLAKHIADAAKDAFAPGHVMHFQDKVMLVKTLRTLAAKGDLILVKGSRGMKLEMVVSAFTDSTDRQS